MISPRTPVIFSMSGSVTIVPGSSDRLLDRNFSVAHEVQEQTVSRQVRNDQAVAVPQDPVVDDLERSYALHRLRTEVDEAAQRDASLVGRPPRARSFGGGRRSLPGGPRAALP